MSKKRVVTPTLVENVEKLYGAGWSTEEVAAVVGVGISTAAKIKTCDFDYEAYANYSKPEPSVDTTGRGWELEPSVAYLFNEKFDDILEQLKQVVDLLNKVDSKPKKRPESEYNKFVREEFEKNPDTNMVKVADKWNRSKRGKKLFRKQNE